jgi:hypothetical protein
MFICPHCAKPIYNRKLTICEFCAKALPAGLCLTPEQIRKNRAQMAAEEARFSDWKRSGPGRPDVGGEAGFGF